MKSLTSRRRISRLKRPPITLFLLTSLLAVGVVGSLRAQSLGPATAPSTLPATRPDFHIDARQTLTYLASDELEGRGVGTAGLNKAADRIADDFAGLGLKTLPGLEGYFQPFTMTTAVVPDPRTALADGKSRYTLDEDFVPLSFSAEKAFEGSAVFVGYGVSSTEFGYDDYAGLDVKGKVVIAMRYEPHTESGASRFSKEDWSPNAHLDRKAQVAADHGAAALILINPAMYHLGDSLIPFSRASAGKSIIPTIQVKRHLLEQWLKQAGKNLAEVQAAIDKAGKPESIDLRDVHLKGEVAILHQQKQVKNVIGVLPGNGPHADELIVVGGHYDHLGYGGMGSLAPGVHAIHHGADDNASGTTAVLMLADHYAHAGPQPRTLVFITFTAEEEGLIGSNYFVNHPPIPLDKVAAMFNLDMVGRVNKNLIYLGGAGTAPSFDSILKLAGEGSPLVQRTFGRGGYGPSDHMSFAMKKIPVLFLFSGLHPDYHRPTDTVDKINFAGMNDVMAMAIKVIDQLLVMPREQYVDASDKDSMMMTTVHISGRVTLGIVPDYSAMDEARGVKISGTSPGSPAEKAGLRAGDTIVQWNSQKVEGLEQLTNLLGNSRPGDKVSLSVLRDGKRVEIQATLAERSG